MVSLEFTHFESNESTSPHVLLIPFPQGQSRSKEEGNKDEAVHNLTRLREIK